MRYTRSAHEDSEVKLDGDRMPRVFHQRCRSQSVSGRELMAKEPSVVEEKREAAGVVARRAQPKMLLYDSLRVHCFLVLKKRADGALEFLLEKSFILTQRAEKMSTL